MNKQSNEVIAAKHGMEERFDEESLLTLRSCFEAYLIGEAPNIPPEKMLARSSSTGSYKSVHTRHSWLAYMACYIEFVADQPVAVDEQSQ